MTERDWRTINHRVLRHTTEVQTMESVYRRASLLFRRLQYADMPKTRFATRKQTKISYQKQSLFPFYQKNKGWPPYLTKPPMLYTNRKKYYYYMKIVQPKPPLELFPVMLVARKPKLKRNNKNFGSLKLIKREKIFISYEYVPKFIWFESGDNNIDELIHWNRIRTSQRLIP